MKKIINAHTKTDKLTVLLPLAVPIFIEQILRNLMGTVNTFMLSRISDDASAAVGVANQILNFVVIFSSMVTSGAMVIVSQHLGAEKKREAGQIMMNSITMCILSGMVVSSILVIFSRHIVTLMGLEKALIADASVYLRILGISCLFQCLSTLISGFFRCFNKAAVPMVIIVFNNVINLMGSLLVVNDLLPIKRVEGIALVRLTGEILGFVLLIVIFFRQQWEQKFENLFRIKLPYIKQIARIGGLAELDGFFYNMTQAVTTSFITAFPAAVLSAKVYTQTVNCYAFLAGLAIGQAAQIMAGYLIGAGKKEEAYRFIKKSWLGILTCNVVFSFLFFIFSDNIVGLFTESEEIKAFAKTLFMIDIFTCIGRSMNHSYNLGLRAANYVFWPMVVGCTSIFLIQISLGYALTLSAGLGIVGLWISQTTDEWVRGSCSAFFWLKKKWEKTAIVKIESAADKN